ncbi:MAG: cytochrome c [Chromatiales bacterium]|nr:cytochrome c [Chromatiales bacterium]
MPGRWYTAAQVEQGYEIFQQHCAVCHGTQAEGAVEQWWIPDEQGNYPPPPLNGTAHDWHHPLDELLDWIDRGGAHLGGQMPPFGHLLSDEEQRAAVAWFQSLWPEEIYRRWVTIHQR